MKKGCLFILTVVTILSFVIVLPDKVKAEEYPAYANPGSSGTVRAALRVRTGPGTGYKQIALISAGTKVTISGTITMTGDGNTWCYCEEYSGYIAINFLDDICFVPEIVPTPMEGFDSQDLTFYPSFIYSGSYGTVKAALRVRTGPGTDYEQINLISAGTIVYISGNVETTSDGNTWCYCDDYSGYIAINFLDDIYYSNTTVTFPPTATPSPTPSPTATPTPSPAIVPSPSPTTSLTATPSPTSTISHVGADIFADAYIEVVSDCVFHTGDVLTINDLSSSIKVYNYSPSYTINAVVVDKSKFAKNITVLTDSFLPKYKAEGTGVYKVKICIKDDFEIYPDLEQTITVKVLPKTREEALEVIQERLNNLYMTVNEKPCGSGGYHVKCDKNCEMHKVLMSQWLKELFPEIVFDKKLFQQEGKGHTCWGGAQIIGYIETQLLNDTPVKVKTVTVKVKKNITTAKAAYNFITKYAQIGDHIRIVNPGTTDGHSVIFLGVAENNKIHVIDVNARKDKEKTNNRVSIYDRSLSACDDGKDIYIYRYTTK